jgi:hypothetical protein
MMGVLSASSVAADDPLIGKWFSPAPTGSDAKAGVYANFTSGGRLTLSCATVFTDPSGKVRSGEFSARSVYHKTGKSSYEGRVIGVDFDMPPSCSGPVGSVFSCRYRFENSYVVYITCGGSSARFNRLQS